MNCRIRAAHITEVIAPRAWGKWKLDSCRVGFYPASGESEGRRFEENPHCSTGYANGLRRFVQYRRNGDHRGRLSSQYRQQAISYKGSRMCPISKYPLFLTLLAHPLGSGRGSRALGETA